MSKINPQRADVKAIYEKFSGVGADVGKNELTAVRLRNFRILSNGVLEKRSGWRVLKEISKPVRSIYVAGLMDYKIYIICCDDSCYCYYEQEDLLFEVPIVDRHSVAPMIPFFYHESLYFMDGTEIYYFNGESIAPAVGYVPLVGIGWDPKTCGEMYEPLNIICNRARVNYLTQNKETELQLPDYASTVERVIVDGRVSRNYSFDSSSKKLILHEGGGSYAEIVFYIARGQEYRYIRECTVSFVDTRSNQDRLFLSGVQPAFETFFARPLTKLMKDGCYASCPDSDALYFTLDSRVTLGDLSHHVNTFYSDHDRILAMTENQIYALTPTTETGGLEYHTLLQGMGCYARMMNLHVDGDPLILNTSGLYRLHLGAGSRLQLDFERIPCPYPELLNPRVIERLIFVQNDANDEVWFRDRLDLNGRVMVYNYRRDCWYEFDNIPANQFTLFNGQICFASDTGVCVLESNLTTDGDLPFEAVCESEYIDFGDPERPKRALRMSLLAKTRGNLLNVRLKTEHRTRDFEFLGHDKDAPDFFDVRAALGRFRQLRVTIYDQEPSRSQISRLALFANL